MHMQPMQHMGQPMQPMQPNQAMPFRKPMFVPGANYAYPNPANYAFDPARNRNFAPTGGAPLAAENIPTQKLNNSGDLRSARAKLMGGNFGI